MELDEIKQKVLEDVDPPTRKKKEKQIKRVVIQTIIEFSTIIILIFLAFQFIWGGRNRRRPFHVPHIA